MATTTNLFDLLSGIGKSEQLQTLKKKSKPKKAKKPETAALADGVHEDQNGSPRALEVSDVVEPVNTVLSTTHVVKTPAQTQYVVIEASEAVAICERAAREAKSLTDKIKLWKDWTRQAADRSGRGLKYKDADGGYLDFTQVVVRSKGLEISIESCLASGLTQDKEPVLSQLLSTFLPPDRAHLAPALASTLVRISTLFTLESPDTLSTAQRAVFAAIAALKLPLSGSLDTSAAGAGSGGGSVSGWLARVSAVEKEVARLNAAAFKLQQGASNGVTREQTQNMKQILALFEEKFQLMQPESVPAAKPATSTRVSPCEKGLSDLRAIISSHMQARQNSSNNSSDASPAAQRAAALASCRREEAILDARTSELLGEVRTLEARLHGLHMEQAELQAKRVQVQHMRSGLDSSVVGGKGGRVQPQGEGLGDAHYRDELAAVEALHCLMDPSRAANNGSSGGAHEQADQVSSVLASQAEAAVELVSQGVAYLEMTLRAMREMPAKLAFCRARCSQAEKLFALGAMSAASSSAAATGTPVVGARQKAEAEKLLAETLKTAEDLVLGSGQVWNDMHLRYDALMRFSPPAAATYVATLVRTIDSLCTQVREAHAELLAEPEPAAPAPAPQRPQSQNRQRQGQSPAAAATSAPQAAQQPQARSDSPQAVPAPSKVTEQRVQQERRPAAATPAAAAESQQPAAAASAAFAALLPKVPQQQAQNNRNTTSERAVPAPRAAVVQLVAASHNTSAAPAPAPASNGNQAPAAPHHPAPIPAAAPATIPTAAPVTAAAPAQLPNGHAISSEATEDSPAAVAAPAPKPAAPAAPPRSWGKVAVAPVSNGSDDSLPTPAEAALALSSDAEGPKEGTSANSRRGGQRSGGGAARLPRA